TKIALPNTDVDWLIHSESQFHCTRHLISVGWRKNSHIRNSAKGRNIFAAMVTGAERVVNKSGAVSDHNNWQVLITYIEFDLFEHPDRNKSTQSVHDGAQAGFC